MANTNAPFGLRPLGLNNATSAPTFSLNGYRKFASNNTQAAFRGDGVQNLDTGFVSAITAAAVGASQWAGVFWGCEYLSAAQGKRTPTTYWPGGDNSGQVVDVQLIPMATSAGAQLFVVQALLTPFTFTDIGQTCDIAYAAGTAYSGYSKSGLTLDRATIGTQAAKPFRIVDLWSSYARQNSSQPGADDTSNYNWVVVAYNMSQETGL